MSLRKLLAILPLLLILGIIACDGETAGNAQDLGADPNLPEEEMTVCPCFTEQDVVNLGDASTDIECANIVFGIALLFNSEGMPAITARCNSDGTGCMCTDPSGEMDITQDAYAVCISNMISAIAQFNSESVKLVGCAAE